MYWLRWRTFATAYGEVTNKTLSPGARVNFDFFLRRRRNPDRDRPLTVTVGEMDAPVDVEVAFQYQGRSVAALMG